MGADALAVLLHGLELGAFLPTFEEEELTLPLLRSMRPDLLLLIADRFEMLAPAAAAMALRIPIAHIEGGEISEGAIDQQVRDALTKMSHL